MPTWPAEQWFEQGYKQEYKEAYREGFREGYRAGRQEELAATQAELSRLVSERFGDAVGATVAAVLNRTNDLQILADIADWLAKHESADAFMARLQRAQRSASAASQVPQPRKHCGLDSVQ